MRANVTPRGAAKAALICLVTAAVLRRMGGERSVPPELASDSATNGLGYQIVLANRDPAALASEASQSCSGACRYPISGLALSPPQEPYPFEGRTADEGGGMSQQVHPSRAVGVIMDSGAHMSMQAVDIGAAGSSPEAGPLFAGFQGKQWAGVKIDPRGNADSENLRVRVLRAKAEPSSIARLLTHHCVPKDVDLLKVDIDSYDWDVARALMDGGFRPKVFAAEVSINFPPPVHMHIGFAADYQWQQLGERPQPQQLLVGSSVSAYSDLLRPLGYTLLCVDHYNVVYVQTQYIHLFGDIPTDDISAWRAGWYDRPQRELQKDLQKYWLNGPNQKAWMAVSDPKARLLAVERFVAEANGLGGSIVSSTPPFSGTLKQRFANMLRGGGEAQFCKYNCTRCYLGHRRGIGAD
jgi:hypothetical protein